MKVLRFIFPFVVFFSITYFYFRLSYYLENEKAKDIAAQKADHTISCYDLAREFETDSLAALKKYEGKLLEIKGVFTYLMEDGGYVGEYSRNELTLTGFYLDSSKIYHVQNEMAELAEELKTNATLDDCEKSIMRHSFLKVKKETPYADFVIRRALPSDSVARFSYNTSCVKKRGKYVYKFQYLSALLYQSVTVKAVFEEVIIDDEGKKKYMFKEGAILKKEDLW